MVGFSTMSWRGTSRLTLNWPSSRPASRPMGAAKARPGWSPLPQIR